MLKVKSERFSAFIKFELAVYSNFCNYLNIIAIKNQGIKKNIEYTGLQFMFEYIEKKNSHSSEPFFISDLPGGDLTDGTIWHGKIYRIGTHKYTTVMGAGKTVAKYIASLGKAMEYYGTIKN